VLKTAAIDVLNIIKRGVIGVKALDVGEIEPLNSSILKDVEISTVSQQSVNVKHVRGRDGIGNCMGKLPDQSSIPGARFKHQRRTAIAPCFEIEE